MLLLVYRDYSKSKLEGKSFHLFTYMPHNIARIQNNSSKSMEPQPNVWAGAKLGRGRSSRGPGRGRNTDSGLLATNGESGLGAGRTDPPLH